MDFQLLRKVKLRHRVKAAKHVVFKLGLWSRNMSNVLMVPKEHVI